MHLNANAGIFSSVVESDLTPERKMAVSFASTTAPLTVERLSVVEEVKKNGWSFLTAVRGGAFTVPGDGDVDFDPVFELLDKAGYEGWLLVEAEQDPAKANPLEYAIKGRKYIAAHTGL